MQGLVKDLKTDKRHLHPKLDRDISPLPGEIWRDLEEWKGHQLQSGYQVSNLGRVRNLGRVIEQRSPGGKIINHPYPPCMLRLSEDPDGYLRVGLCRVDSKHAVTPGVHQLVAQLFLDQKPREDQTHVNHIDGNKHNNTPANLEWASPAENNEHARKNGLARLGTSQSIKGRVVEWGVEFESKSKTDAALGRYSGYVDYCMSHNLPIKDKNSGQVVHVQWIQREDIING